MKHNLVFITLFFVFQKSYVSLILQKVLNRYLYFKKAIVNGTNAGINPHHVSVIAFTADYTEIHHGGSLISNVHVLTAASVVDDKILFRCGIGSNRRSLLTYIDSNFSFKHPDYNVLTRNSDIGIIILPWGTITAFTGKLLYILVKSIIEENNSLPL